MARFSAAKDDIVSHGIGSGVYCGGRFARFGVRMHTHLSEVMAETWFHHAARCLVKRVTRRGQDVGDAGWQKRR